MTQDLYVLNLLNKLSLVVIEGDINALFAVHGVSILAVSLSDHKLGEVSFVFLNLGRVFVDTLGLQPAVRPTVKVELLVRTALIEALLHAADEVTQFSVCESKTLEVDLEAAAEDFPAHQEDQLFDHRGTLTVSNTIDERLSRVCMWAISLDFVV